MVIVIFGDNFILRYFVILLLRYENHYKCVESFLIISVETASA